MSNVRDGEWSQCQPRSPGFYRMRAEGVERVVSVVLVRVGCGEMLFLERVAYLLPERAEWAAVATEREPIVDGWRW